MGFLILGVMGLRIRIWKFLGAVGLQDDEDYPRVAYC